MTTDNFVKLECGDWEVLVKDVPDKSVDLVFCDLPYASKTFGRCVDCKWDTPINLDKLWAEISRIRRTDHTPIFMCCNMKFAVDLIDSNKKEFRYDLIWVKSAPCGFLSARKMPMKKHEIVLVFYKRLPFYDLSTHTHKFLKSGKSNRDKNSCYGNALKTENSSKYDPPLPVSVLEKTEQNGIYGTLPTSEKLADTQGIKRTDKHKTQYDPPLPVSVIEVKDGAVNENFNSLYGDMKTPEYVSNNITRNKLRRQYKKEGKSDSAYDPPLPVSVLEDVKDADCYDFTNRLKNGKLQNYDKELYVGRNGGTAYDPPLPTSVLEKTETMKMELENTIYGDITLNQPANQDGTRNKYRGKFYEPPLPVSVLEGVGNSKEYIFQKGQEKKTEWEGFNNKSTYQDPQLITGGEWKKTTGGVKVYDPPLPTSVLEEGAIRNINRDNKEVCYGKGENARGVKYTEDYRDKTGGKKVWQPGLPTSVLEQPNETIDKLDDDMIQKLKELSTNMEMKIEEIVDINDVDTNLNIEVPMKTSTITNINTKGDCYDFMNRIKQGKLKRLNVRWSPPLPTSVIEEVKKPYFHKEGGTLPTTIMGSVDYHGARMGYEPTLPTSVIEDTYQDYILDPPDTLLRIKSQKGKHATQKPTDLMKWAFKYYSKPGDVIFDPTCGSGSTGVAAVQMNRSFIGFERDEEIFKVAEQRIKIDKI